MDHPVELQQWETGVHKLGFSELAHYISRHPKVVPHGEQAVGLAELKSEYAKLSQAVHASARRFRMTENADNVLLWIPKTENLNQWHARERNVLRSLNLLLIVLFEDRIVGNAHVLLRRTVGLVMSGTMRKSIRDRYHVVLPST